MDAEAKNFEGLKEQKKNYSQRLKLDLMKNKGEQAGEQAKTEVF
jgi:hypothetical protein